MLFCKKQYTFNQLIFIFFLQFFTVFHIFQNFHWFFRWKKNWDWNCETVKTEKSYTSIRMLTVLCRSKSSKSSLGAFHIISEIDTHINEWWESRASYHSLSVVCTSENFICKLTINGYMLYAFMMNFPSPMAPLKIRKLVKTIVREMVNGEQTFALRFIFWGCERYW